MVLREFAQENRIKLLDFPSLDEVDELTAFKTVQENFEKVSRIVPEFEMTIQAKQYSKSGARRQHEVHARIIAPRKRFVATSVEWNFLTALQECLKELKHEVLKASGKK